MQLLQSSLENFWLFSALALFLAYLNGSNLSSVGIVNAFGYLIGLPATIAFSLFKAAPFIAVPALLLFLTYTSKLKETIGEGYHAFALFAFLAFLAGA